MPGTLPDLIAARILIPGPDGRPRIEIGLVNGEPAIRMLDADGKVRVRLGLECDNEETGFSGLTVELRLTGGSDGGEASLVASSDNYAAIEISAKGHGSDDEAAGAWIEAKEGRIEGNLHDRPGGDGWSFSAGNVRPRLVENNRDVGDDEGAH